MLPYLKFVLVLGFISQGVPMALAASTNELAAIERAQEACIAADESNAGMRQCTDAALRDADDLLNSAYQKISADLTGRGETETLTRLKTAQRAWIPFRDAQCSLASAQMLGGTGEPVIQLSCHYKMTVDRVKQLEEQFDSEL